ncbi:MAG: hypothetical protein IPO29_01260 [Anaerolineae bacterium]|nr:hypothetical protein [Anaerolineae bacterium]
MLTASPIRDEAGSVIGIMGISTDLRERQRLERELLAQQRATAVLQERERPARELHDDIGQVLGYINTQSQAVSALFDQRQPEAAATLARRLTEVAQEAHGNVRNLHSRAADLNQCGRRRRPRPADLCRALRATCSKAWMPTHSLRCCPRLWPASRPSRPKWPPAFCANLRAARPRRRPAPPRPTS